MNIEADAADMVFRLLMDGSVYFFKIGAAGIKGGAKGIAALAGLAQSVASQDVRSRGRVKFERIVREGKGLSTFMIPLNEFETFARQAKAYRLLYCPIMPENQEQDPLASEEVGGEEQKDHRMVTIFCAGDKANIVNTLIKANRLHGRQVAEAEPIGVEREAVQEKPVEAAPVQRETGEVTTPEDVQRANEEFLRSINGEGEPVKAEQEEAEHPTQAAEKKESQSGNNSQKSPAASVSEELHSKPMEAKLQKHDRIWVTMDMFTEAMQSTGPIAEINKVIGADTTLEGGAYFGEPQRYQGKGADYFRMLHLPHWISSNDILTGGLRFACDEKGDFIDWLPFTQGEKDFYNNTMAPFFGSVLKGYAETLAPGQKEKIEELADNLVSKMQGKQVPEKVSPEGEKENHSDRNAGEVELDIENLESEVVPDLDIERLPSAIEATDGRISVRDTLSEIKEMLAEAEKGPAEPQKEGNAFQDLVNLVSQRNQGLMEQASQKPLQKGE